MTATTLRWCSTHDEPARARADYCVFGRDCDIEDVDEEANRCLGGCGRHTLARFEGGTHGPGPYCGWCNAIPA